ncbi:mitotic spindle checkpoint protein Bub3 [Varicellaria rhodocarpa]|nr:mitotic spindle checkpoint protein Bub3 [Varicellaria rhodocarpa]
MSASSPFGQVKVYQDPVPIDPAKTIDASHFFAQQSFDSISCKPTPDVCANWQQLIDIAMSDNDVISPQPRSTRVSPILSDSHLERLGVSPDNSEDYSTFDDTNGSSSDDSKDLNHVVNMTIRSLPNHFPPTNQSYGESRREGDPSSSPLFVRSYLPSRNAQSETSDPSLRDRLGRERLPPYGPRPFLPPGLPIPSLTERRKNANGGTTPPAIESDFSKEKWPDNNMEELLESIRISYFEDLLSTRTRATSIQSLGPIAPPNKSQLRNDSTASNPKAPAGYTNSLSTIPSSKKENMLPLSSKSMSLGNSDTSVVSNHFPTNPNHIHMAPSGHSSQPSEARRVPALEHGTSSNTATPAAGANPSFSYNYFPSNMPRTELNPLANDFQPPTSRDISSSSSGFTQNASQNGDNNHGNIYQFRTCMHTHSSSNNLAQNTSWNGNNNHRNGFQSPMSGQNHSSLNTTPSYNAQSEINSQTEDSRTSLLRINPSTLNRTSQHVVQNDSNTLTNDFQVPMYGINQSSLNQNLPNLPQNGVNSSTNGFQPLTSGINYSTLNRDSSHMPQNRGNIGTNGFQPHIPGSNQTYTPDNNPRDPVPSAINARTNLDQSHAPGSYNPRLPYNNPRYRMPNVVNAHINSNQPQAPGSSNPCLPYNDARYRMPSAVNAHANSHQPQAPGSYSHDLSYNDPRYRMPSAINARTNSDQPQAPGSYNPGLPHNNPRHRMPNVVNAHINSSQPQAPGSMYSSSSNNVPPNTVQNVPNTYNNTPGRQVSQWGILPQMTSRSNPINVDDTFTRALEQMISSMNHGICGSGFRVMISPHGSNSQTSTNSCRPKPVTIIIERFIRFDEENVASAIQAGQSQALSVLEQFKSECKTRLGIRGWKLLDSKRVTHQVPKRGWQEAFVLVQKPT